MLKKLLKHDTIAVGRLALPILGAIVLISLVAGLICGIPFKNPILATFPSLLFFAAFFLIIIACVAVFLITVVHFYRNLLTGEGYLTFTLPVKTSSIVTSKLIVGATTMLLAVLVTVPGLLFLISRYSHSSISDFFAELAGLIDSSKAALYLIVLVIFFLISLVWQQLAYYLAIALGQVLCKNKLVGALVAYMILNVVVQVLSFVVLIAVVVFVGLDGAEAFMGSIDGMLIIFGASGFEMLLLTIAGFIATTRLLGTKLNLE